jgi:hypothetical protein
LPFQTQADRAGKPALSLSWKLSRCQGRARLESATAALHSVRTTGFRDQTLKISTLAACLACIPVAAAAQEAAAPPLPVTIRAQAPAPVSNDRIAQLLARREAAARRLQYGICRGCLRADASEPANRMIEVSVARPRASWETTVPALPAAP